MAEPRSAAGGDPSRVRDLSWGEIVERHSDRVYRLAYRLTGNRADAEDLTQEVFVRVFRSLDTFTPGTFEGWLHRITTNLFLDQARRKQRIRFDALSDERAERLTSATARARTAPSPTRRSTTTSSARSRPCRPTSARRSCSATSRASPTRRSPPSSTPSSAPCARASTAAGRCCGPRWRTGRRRRAASATPAPRARRRRSRDRPPRHPRVSALLDGQLSPAEAERAWAHVHACHACRDLVEREGWVKTQLAALSGAGGTPDRLKGELSHGSFLGAPPLPTASLGQHALARRRRLPGRYGAGRGRGRRARPRRRPGRGAGRPAAARDQPDPAEPRPPPRRRRPPPVDPARAGWHRRGQDSSVTDQHGDRSEPPGTSPVADDAATTEPIGGLRFRRPEPGAWTPPNAAAAAAAPPGSAARAAAPRGRRRRWASDPGRPPPHPAGPAAGVRALERTDARLRARADPRPGRPDRSQRSRTGRVSGWVWPVVAALALVVGLLGGALGAAAYEQWNDSSAAPGGNDGGLDGVSTREEAPLPVENGSVAAVAQELLPSTVQIVAAVRGRGRRRHRLGLRPRRRGTHRHQQPRRRQRGRRRRADRDRRHRRQPLPRRAGRAQPGLRPGGALRRGRHAASGRPRSAPRRR